MEPLWIAFAFVFGLAARRVGLPPMVGFLVAGFALAAAGVPGGPVLDVLEEFGVTLLLFTIGLKIRLGSLLRPEVWGGASVHLLANLCLLGLALAALAAGGLREVAGLPPGAIWLLAFALSFSSTVFTVKVLEGGGESGSLHGRVAIGILIMQDVFAVGFLALSAGKTPSPWALGLLGLPALRPLLGRLLQRAGHGELLVLTGVVLGLGLGRDLFEAVGVKGDLGALLVGMLLAPHPKADELSRTLMGFKDLFLVAFFLNIGISGLPGLEPLWMAALLTLLVPLKGVLYFAVLTRFGLRARSSLLASLSLLTYSEFGLIVCAVGVDRGWIPDVWLLSAAIAVAFSFVLASLLNVAAPAIQRRLGPSLSRFETARRHPEERPIDLRGADVIVVGMGRVGTGAYDALAEEGGRRVIGIDRDPVVVEHHGSRGRNVILADLTDGAVWDRIEKARAHLVLLATDRHAANLHVAREAAARDLSTTIAATARWDDEDRALRELGVPIVFNLFQDAGRGFADQVTRALEGAEARGRSPSIGTPPSGVGT